jgi:hypothetical protein
MITPLDIQFDLNEALDYYYTLESKFQHLKYTPDANLLDGSNHKISNFYGWGIQSNLEDLTKPCPPYHVHKNGSNVYRNTELVFGFAEKITLVFPEARQLGIAVHPPGVEIEQHVDNDEYFKIHIPLISNLDSYFIFEDKMDRMLPGKLYAVDTQYMHGTSNKGSTNRVHLLFKIPRNLLTTTLSIKGIL